MNEYIDTATNVGAYLFDVYVRALPALQVFSLVITGVLLFFVVLMMKRANVVGGKRDKLIDQWNLADMTKVRAERAWKSVMQGIAVGGDAAMKKAIADADKLLSDALKNAGIAGSTVDERLKNADAMRIANIEEVREAHRFAARLQKEPALSLTQQEARNLTGIYEKALKDLGLLK